MVSEELMDAGGHIWAIVLAGGQGRRLRPLIQRVHKDDRPKQFAALLGSRSLLRQTLVSEQLERVRDRTSFVVRFFPLIQPHSPGLHHPGATVGDQAGQWRSLGDRSEP